LASNTHLKKNLKNQVPIYEKANSTNQNIKVIMYFDTAEFTKVTDILKDLNLDNEKNIVLIDAGVDNKISASKA
jgi:hypothetical protein